MERLVAGIDKVNDAVGTFAGWLTAFLVLNVTFDVITRYIFNFSIVASQELEWHVYSLTFLLGMGWGLKEDRHVRVDIFYTNQSPRVKAWINLIGSFIFLLPFSILGFMSTLPYVETSFRNGEISNDPGGLPYRWLIKGAVLVGFVLLFIQAIAEVIKAIRYLRGSYPELEERLA